jgi:Zn-dependent protease
MFGNLESAFSPENLRVLALVVPILILSMVLHELAHAYVANRLGDPTARMLGRLTPNPLVHIDPMGSIMFAATWILSGGSFLFGWAKPIPVQPRFFNHPQRGFAIVAIAGPIANILIAYVIALVYVWVFSYPTGLLGEVLATAFVMNVLLAVFNMLPIPPLDGSRVLAAFMPREMAEAWGRLDQYGFMILFGLLLFFRPLFDIINAIREPIQRLLLTLAGA